MMTGRQAGKWMSVWVHMSKTELLLVGYNQSRLVVNFAKT